MYVHSYVCMYVCVYVVVSLRYAWLSHSVHVYNVYWHMDWFWRGIKQCVAVSTEANPGKFNSRMKNKLQYVNVSALGKGSQLLKGTILYVFGSLMWPALLLPPFSKLTSSVGRNWLWHITVTCLVQWSSIPRPVMIIGFDVLPQTWRHLLTSVTILHGCTGSCLGLGWPEAHGSICGAQWRTATTVSRCLHICGDTSKPISIVVGPGMLDWWTKEVKFMR